MSARLTPQGGELVRAVYPMGRNGRMPELANLAVFLMSTQAEYLTGQTIAIDGGQYQATGGNFSGLASWGDQDWANARSAIESRNAADRQQRTA
jgi:hypothetical protein